MHVSSTLHYRIAMMHPGSHRFQVRITWSGPGEFPEQWALPVWTPGSYLVREFSKHVGPVRAASPSKALAVRKTGKSTWSVDLPEPDAPVTLEYEVYAFELSVRTSYLDGARGYFNGANVFWYPQTAAPYTIELEVVPAPGWDVATALDRLPQPGFVYAAPDYDTLVDSPVECGTLRRETFTVGGTVHELVLTGMDQIDVSPLLRDLPPIIQAAQDVFGGPLPYDRYVFLVHGAQGTGGGLEHRNSASIIFDRFMLHSPDQYPRVLALFAHEYFHVWNVKRLHPHNLGPFDYQHEVFTTLLWVLEGWTDYYAWILLARAGAVEPTVVLKHFAESLRVLDGTPGRAVQSVAEASWDTWIKFYRPDGDSPNSTVSYYLKGALVALFLDLSLRRATAGQSSLDAVMRDLWDQYGDQGYGDGAVEEALIKEGGPIVRQWLESWVYGTAEWDSQIWADFGLTLSRDFKNPQDTGVFTGIIAERMENGGILIKHVLRGSPAEAAGLGPGDEWIALDTARIRFQDLETRLAQCIPGQEITLSIFRNNHLQTYGVVPEPPRPNQWALTRLSDSTEKARQQFREWLGAPLP